LEERGVAVRAMIRHERNIARLGRTSASIVIGDFDDANSIAAALDGIDSAYLVTPSSINAEAQQIRFAEIAAAANVKHLVKLSQFAADEASLHPSRTWVTHLADQVWNPSLIFNSVGEMKS
jgi:uncharacterized protein YbjT (DUF2867 family)